MKKNIVSILMVCLLLLSLLPVGALAEDTNTTDTDDTEQAEDSEEETSDDDAEDSEDESDVDTDGDGVSDDEEEEHGSNPNDATSVPEDGEEGPEVEESTERPHVAELLELLKELNLLGGDNDLEDMHEQAKFERESARAYYFLTEKILSAEAVIAFFGENYDEADISDLEEYKDALGELRSGIDADTDFDELKEEVLQLIKEGKDDLNDLLDEYDVDKDELIQYVADYKDATDEDEEAKDSWALTRSAYVQAKAEVILDRLESIVEIVEFYLGEGSAEDLEDLMDDFEDLVEDISDAQENFDDKAAQDAMKEAHDLIKDAKSIIKNLWLEIREDYWAEWKSDHDFSHDEITGAATGRFNGDLHRVSKIRAGDDGVTVEE